MAIGHFFARLRLEWPPHLKGAEPLLFIFNRFRQSAYQLSIFMRIQIDANHNLSRMKETRIIKTSTV